jgi:hypothetical protein
MSLYHTSKRGGKTTPPPSDSTQKQAILLFPNATLGTARLTSHQRFLSTLKAACPDITNAKIMAVLDIVYTSVTGYSTLELRRLWALPAPASVRGHLRDCYPVLYRYIQTDEEILIREIDAKREGGEITFNVLLRLVMEWENYFTIQARDARNHLKIDVCGYDEDDPF